MSNEGPTNYDEFEFLQRYAEYEGVPWNGRPAVRRESLEVNDGQRLSALVWGNDDPELVLVHGSGQNAHTWDSVAMVLDRPLIAIDLPGHGHSDWREDGDYSPQTNALALAPVIEQFAPNAKAVVGMSLGGLTTMRITATRPDLAPRAVLVDITPGVASRQLTAEQQGAVALISGPASFDTFEDMLAATAARAPGRPIDTLRPGVLHNSRQTEDGRWSWRYDRLDRHGEPAQRMAGITALWDDISAITVPVMLVRGGNSPFVIDEDREEFLRRHPDTRFEVVEGAHHSVQSDQATRLARLIDEFISKA